MVMITNAMDDLISQNLAKLTSYGVALAEWEERPAPRIDVASDPIDAVKGGDIVLGGGEKDSSHCKQNIVGPALAGEKISTHDQAYEELQRPMIEDQLDKDVSMAIDREGSSQISERSRADQRTNASKWTAHKLERLFEEIDFSRYCGQYISSLKIFRDHSALMDECGIVDHNSLYDILREARFVLMKFDAEFIRRPSIRFGNGDMLTQAKDLIEEMSPVDIETISKEYEDRYGIIQKTAKVILYQLYEYYHDSVYDINIPKLDDAALGLIKEKMTHEWYLTEDVGSIFSEIAGKEWEKFLNPYNLKALGFNLTEKYVYSSKFRSSEECFESVLRKGLVFSVGPDLKRIQAVYSLIKKKESELEILPISDDQYVDVTRLHEEKKISKDLLMDYSLQVWYFADDDDYFTLASIESQGFYHPLRDLGFDDIFYETILKQNPLLKNLKLFATTVFRKGDDATVTDFIDYVVSRTGSMDLYDFMEMMQSRYRIVPDRAGLIRYLKQKQSKVYYNERAEKIYVDKEEYYEEMGIT